MMPAITLSAAALRIAEEQLPLAFGRTATIFIDFHGLCQRNCRHRRGRGIFGKEKR